MDISEEALERFVETVSFGGAVCLLGAGYSVGATDQKTRDLPDTVALIAEIKAAVGIDPLENVSLSDIADYCEDDAARTLSLRQILINRLTLANPTEDQQLLARQRWRSIFTTNFDDVVERSLSDGAIQPIAPAADPATHDPSRTPLYYLHGRARDLLGSDVDPKLVISDRNYLRLHDDNRALYARLKNELFCANLIVVIGYSMRDLEVARMLIEGGHAFKSKTLIVCDPKDGPVALARLKKFGEVVPIGVSGLAERFRQLEQRPPAVSDSRYQFIDKIDSVDPSLSVEVDDFINLILTGAFSREKYQNQLQQDQSTADTYAIRRRTASSTILDRAADGVRRYVVSSDLGNGKSIFLDQIAEELLVSGYEVAKVSSDLTEVHDEIEQLIACARPTAFLIDDVIRHRAVARFVGARLNSSSILICTVRGDPNEAALRELIGSLGGATRSIDLNRLSNEELQDWDRTLERWGLWEHRRELPTDQRIAFLSGACGAENRSIVLSLFKTSRIATKIDQVVTFFVNNGRHERAFAALLVSSLCQQHIDWENLVSWLDLDEARLRQDIASSEISALFLNGRQWNAFTSSQLAEYILRNKYVSINVDVIVDVFSTVVLCTAESAFDIRLGSASRENLKELMKFRFLTRLFGGDDSATKVIGTVYKRLSKSPYIRENPKFWLQYAMSRMEVNDLSNAETYLNTALGLASKRGVTYSPFQILDQRARLYFKKNCKPGGSFKKSEIDTAIRDLTSLLAQKEAEIIYMYRSVPIIGDFIECHIDELSADLRNDIKAFLEELKARGEAYDKLPRSQKGETKLLQGAMADALTTLTFG